MLRNTTTRLIVLHLLLVAASTALVLGFVYWRVGGVIDAEQRAVVQAEIRGLVDDYDRGATPALARAINARLAAPQGRDAIYLLTDAGGAPIAGNLTRWPPTLAPGTGWIRLSLYPRGGKRPADISALSVILPQGERLLVGRDEAARLAFDWTLGGALVWALLAMTGLALATGWFLSRLVRSRIDAVDGAARAIMAGALDRRVALSGTGDEFDRLAGTLNAMLDRIETLLRDLRTVTDSLAHDLRSPLGRLVRHLESAADENAAPEARRAGIEYAQREAENVLSTASALLDISRIDAGIGADQFTPVDLSRLAPDVAELYDAVAEERGVHIVWRAEPGLVVQGHRQLLAQALSNLLDNAVKYAPPNSEITVAANRRDGCPTLAVGDRGPGVAEAERTRALGRFVRLDPSRGGTGAGLGLALVDAVARLHGGEIVLSDNGPGLLATLRLPSAQLA